MRAAARQAHTDLKWMVTRPSSPGDTLGLLIDTIIRNLDNIHYLIFTNVQVNVNFIWRYLYSYVFLAA